MSSFHNDSKWKFGYLLQNIIVSYHLNPWEVSEIWNKTCIDCLRKRRTCKRSIYIPVYQYTNCYVFKRKKPFGYAYYIADIVTASAWCKFTENSIFLHAETNDSMSSDGYYKNSWCFILQVCYGLVSSNIETSPICAALNFCGRGAIQNALKRFGEMNSFSARRDLIDRTTGIPRRCSCHPTCHYFGTCCSDAFDKTYHVPVGGPLYRRIKFL